MLHIIQLVTLALVAAGAAVTIWHLAADIARGTR